VDGVALLTDYQYWERLELSSWMKSGCLKWWTKVITNFYHKWCMRKDHV